MVAEVQFRGCEAGEGDLLCGLCNATPQIHQVLFIVDQTQRKENESQYGP